MRKSRKRRNRNAHTPKTQTWSGGIHAPLERELATKVEPMETVTTSGAGVSFADEREARRTLARIMVALGRASDPREVFDAHENELFAVLKVLGPGHPSVKVLEERGLIAASVPLIETESDGVVAPPSVEPALQAVVSGGERRVPVEIQSVAGSHDHGFRLGCMIDGEQRVVYALRFRGKWVFSHTTLNTDDLEIVFRAFLRHFDITFAPALSNRGMSSVEIHSIRRQLRPVRALWPTERDPRGLCDDYPQVYLLENGIGTGHSFYCGFDPDPKTVVPYDHL